MKTKTLKSKNITKLHLKMWKLCRKGWIIKKLPYQNWLGVWKCKLKKD